MSFHPIPDPWASVPRIPLEDYLMTWCGEDPSLGLPRRPLDYYLDILTGLGRGKLLSEYLAVLAGVAHDPRKPLEWYFMQMIGETPTTPLPGRPLGFYASQYTPYPFFYRVDRATLTLHVFGSEQSDPLPTTWITGGRLHIDSATLPAGYTNPRIGSDGCVHCDVP